MKWTFFLVDSWKKLTAVRQKCPQETGNELQCSILSISYCPLGKMIWFEWQGPWQSPCSVWWRPCIAKRTTKREGPLIKMAPCWPKAIQLIKQMLHNLNTKRRDLALSDMTRHEQNTTLLHQSALFEGGYTSNTDKTGREISDAGHQKQISELKLSTPSKINANQNISFPQFNGLNWLSGNPFFCSDIKYL